MVGVWLGGVECVGVRELVDQVGGVVVELTIDRLHGDVQAGHCLGEALAVAACVDGEQEVAPEKLGNGFGFEAGLGGPGGGDVVAEA